MTGNPMVAKTELDGVKTISSPFPFRSPFSLRPTLARSGDYLFLTSSDSCSRTSSRCSRARRAATNPPPNSKSFPRVFRAKAIIFRWSARSWASRSARPCRGCTSAQGGDDGRRGKCHAGHDDHKRDDFAYSVGVNGPEGWEAFGNGNKSMATAAVILPAVATVAVGAAMLLPVSAKAKAEGAPKHQLHQQSQAN